MPKNACTAPNTSTPAPCYDTGPLRPKEVISTNSYELMLMLSAEAEAERQKEILDRVKKTATDGGGSVAKVDEWGKKRLAYEINHLREAYYFVITLTVPSDVLDEITRVLKITDEVVRYMPVVLKEKVASGS